MSGNGRPTELYPTIVVFAGEYDVGSKASLRSLLDRIAEIPDLVLDFREVTFIDSTCVTELLRMHTLRITNSLARETIVLGTTPIRRLFEVLDLCRVFNVVENIADAPHPVGALRRVDFHFAIRSGDEARGSQRPTRTGLRGSATSRVLRFRII